MVRKISDQENFFICSHIQEGVKNGESDEQIQERRKWLAERLDLSLHTIAAISAHLKIRAAKILEGFPTEMHEEARERIALIGGAARADAQEIFAAEKGVDVRIVAAMTDGVMPEDVGGIGLSGEHADYDNETKQKWRKEWAQFIDENTDKKNRSSMRVLCLPGKKCLEIPLYLQLGFSPKNIVGVEGGDRVARAEFELNALRFGIDYRMCDLEDVLSTEKPFDVVSLDFHGFMGKKNFEICQRVPLADKALVMTNFLARREKGFCKEFFAHLMTRYNEAIGVRQLDHEVGKRQASLLRGFVNGVIEKVSPLMLVLGLKRPKKVNPENLNLDEARGQMCPGLYNVGMLAHNKMRAFGPKVENFVEKPMAATPVAQLEMGEKRKFAVGLAVKEEYRLMSLEIIAALCELGKVEPDRLSDVSRLRPFFEIFAHTIFETPHLRKIRKTSYKSDTTSSSMYTTDMAVLETPSAVYAEVRRTAAFLLRCIERKINEQEREDSFDSSEMNMAIFISNHANNGHRRPKAHFMPKEDSIILRKGDAILEHFPLRHFMQDVRKFARIFDQDAWEQAFGQHRSIIE